MLNLDADRNLQQAKSVLTTVKDRIDRGELFEDLVKEISEDEGHHPDISFGWGYAEIKITTHAIEGLSENDFILAAKIDQLINV